MEFVLFDKEKVMTSELQFEILDIKRALWGVDFEDSDNRRTIENRLSGLFDGYSYKSLVEDCFKYLPVELSTRIMRVLFICNEATL